jgi:hypothetical protein
LFYGFLEEVNTGVRCGITLLGKAINYLIRYRKKKQKK